MEQCGSSLTGPLDPSALYPRPSKRKQKKLSRREREAQEKADKRRRLEEQERERQAIQAAEKVAKASRSITYNVSDDLKAIIGEAQSTRKNAIRLVKKYIEDNNLRDEEGNVSTNDVKLKKAFGDNTGQYILVREVRKHLSLPTGRENGASNQPQVQPQVAEVESWKSNAKRTQKLRTGVFSSQEDQIIKDRVKELALRLGHSTEKFDWLFAQKQRNQKYKWGEGVWAQIAAALPERSYRSVYDHGMRLFKPTLKGKWSKEEDKQLKELYQKYPKDWRVISQIIGRSAESCRTHYRQILSNTTKGVPWSEEERSKLEELVTKFLRERAQSSQDTGPRRQKDDISWVRIAKEMKECKMERSAHQCMQKWYKELSPSMVQTGEWGQGDDRAMLKSLLKQKGKPEWHIDWASILPQRSASQTKRRWQLMQKYITEPEDRSLDDKVMFLVSKFAPHLLSQESDSE